VRYCATMQPKKIITVDRQKWHRGSSFAQQPQRFAGSSALLVSETGRMCCLGFACKQLGVPENDLADIGLPGELHVRVKGLNRPWTVKEKEMYPLVATDSQFTETEFAEKAARINDNTDIDDKEREKQLKALAKKHRFQPFKFIN
jgi:hypothetical protein